jgi:hypothetical protein
LAHLFSLKATFPLDLAGELSTRIESIRILAKRFVKDNQSVTRSIAGETIIVPVRSGVSDLNSIYSLNEVGTAIWQLIDGQRTAEQIIEAISDEYDVDAEQAAKDVFEYLGKLEAEGLVRQSEEGKA